MFSLHSGDRTSTAAPSRVTPGLRSPFPANQAGAPSVHPSPCATQGSPQKKPRYAGPTHSASLSAAAGAAGSASSSTRRREMRARQRYPRRFGPEQNPGCCGTQFRQTGACLNFSYTDYLTPPKHGRRHRRRSAWRESSRLSSVFSVCSVAKRLVFLRVPLR